MHAVFLIIGVAQQEVAHHIAFIVEGGHHPFAGIVGGGIHAGVKLFARHGVLIAVGAPHGEGLFIGQPRGNDIAVAGFIGSESHIHIFLLFC